MNSEQLNKEYQNIISKLDDNNKLLHRILSIIDSNYNNMSPNMETKKSDNSRNNIKNKINLGTIEKDANNISSEIEQKNINIEEINNKKKKNKNVSYYKDIKRESITIDENIVKIHMDNCSLQSDVDLFKLIYIDNNYKEYFPIRHIKKKLQYWFDNKMNDDDTNGTYIKTTILKNIEELYLKINNYDNYTNNIEQFLKNQEHINVLMEEKYKDKFLAKLIELITI